jgi:hypothetical protein
MFMCNYNYYLMIICLTKLFICESLASIYNLQCLEMNSLLNYFMLNFPLPPGTKRKQTKNLIMQVFNM